MTLYATLAGCLALLHPDPASLAPWPTIVIDPAYLARHNAAGAYSILTNTITLPADATRATVCHEAHHFLAARIARDIDLDILEDKARAFETLIAEEPAP